MKPEEKVFKALKVAGWVVLGIVGGSALAVLFGFIVMWLWNRLMGGIFGLPELSYWEAVGVLILAKIFFGCMGGGGGHHKSKKKKWDKWDGDNWDMGPDDWQHFKEYWHSGGKEHFHSYRESHRGVRETIGDEIKNEIRKEMEKERKVSGEDCGEDDQD